MKKLKEGDKVTVTLKGIVTWNRKKNCDIYLPDVSENTIYIMGKDKRFKVKRRK